MSIKFIAIVLFVTITLYYNFLLDLHLVGNFFFANHEYFILIHMTIINAV